MNKPFFPRMHRDATVAAPYVLQPVRQIDAPRQAPNYIFVPVTTEATDVYSFGAFLLEVACGRKPICYEEGDVLVDRVWKRWRDSQILDTANPALLGMYDEWKMTKVLCLGLLYSRPSPILRPSMRRVLLVLNGEVSLPHVPPSKPRPGEEIQRILLKDLGSWSTTSSHSSSSAYKVVVKPRQQLLSTKIFQNMY
jgi:hypothetical protein